MKKVTVKKAKTESLGHQVLLTERQAAAVMQLTPRALQAWRYKGGGPKFIRISRRCIRYRREDLEQWLTKRLRSSTSDPGPQGEADV